MNPDLPLTEPQERRLAITLARLEQQLDELGQVAGQPLRSLRLTEYEDPISAELARPIQEAIEAALRQLRKLADDLELSARTEFIRRRHSARLQLALVDLYEARPEKGMRGCGPVSPPTAEHLETVLPELEQRVQRLLDLLQPPPATPRPPRK